MRQFCCEPRRLELVKQFGALDGIEYVEVRDLEEPVLELRQRTLFVKLLLDPTALTAANIVIDGGERLRTVPVEWVAPATALPAGESPALVASLDDPGRTLVVRTKSGGDFSRYYLRLVTAPGDPAPPPGFDPRLAEIEFSFKIECQSDFDCGEKAACDASPLPAPPLDYLAKDYASFRRLMLDRMSLAMPHWRPGGTADPAVALVELLAYVGDHLSYQQDAIGTEAYLDTARRRISVRRHARLVDYTMHEGCNARVWMRMTAGAAVTLPRGTALFTRLRGLRTQFAVDSAEWVEALARNAKIFETAEDGYLRPEHAVVPFYTWGDHQCCLPQGSTRATLAGDYPLLAAGDVLVFVETRSPTDPTTPGDRAHRCAVRLTSVRSSHDPSGGLFDAAQPAMDVPLTEIEWDEDDALPFPLCLSVTVNGVEYEASEAWGNIVLADEGRTVPAPFEALDAVPADTLSYARPRSASHCGDNAIARRIPARFRPTLVRAPLTHAVDVSGPLLFESPTSVQIEVELQGGVFSQALKAWLRANGARLADGARVRGPDGRWSVEDGKAIVEIRRVTRKDGTVILEGRGPRRSATASLRPAAGEALPAISLDPAGVEWSARQDLLASGAEDTHFVVETDDEGYASLRFGDGVHGKRPPPAARLRARYRFGNGSGGNVGAESIAHVADVRIAAVSNPMPAAGGVDPQSPAEVRRDAPEAFRVQERAVTPDDYGDKAEEHAEVQRAAGTFRWTGSWHTAFVSVDRRAGLALDEALELDLRRHLERYRMAGQDIEVDGAKAVALDLMLHVCVRPDRVRSDVRAALSRRLGSGIDEHGERGLFHPDNFSFGDPVYLSRIVAAAQSIDGVVSVTPVTFQRRGDASSSGIDDGVLRMGRLEVACLDNDRNYPDRGVLKLDIGGGR